MLTWEIHQESDSSNLAGQLIFSQQQFLALHCVPLHLTSISTKHSGLLGSFLSRNTMWKIHQKFIKVGPKMTKSFLFNFELIFCHFRLLTVMNCFFSPKYCPKDHCVEYENRNSRGGTTTHPTIFKTSKTKEKQLSKSTHDKEVFFEKKASPKDIKFIQEASYWLKKYKCTLDTL